MAFVQTELAQHGQNGVGAQYSDIISTEVTPAGLGFFFYRNSADDDVTAANFFDAAEELTAAPAGLLWVVEGGEAPTGGTLYTWATAGDPTVVTLVVVAPPAV